MKLQAAIYYVKTPFRILSSKEFLLWLIGGWIIYYITSALWSKEVFSHFADGLVGNPLIKVTYVIFLISASLNFIRSILSAYKKGWAYLLLWFFLPLGIILFLTSLFLSLNARKEEKLVVGKGQIISLPWEKSQYVVSSIPPVLKEDITGMRKDKGIFAYEPDIILINEKQELLKVGAYPPKKIGDTYFHILNFGLAPGVRLFENNKPVNEGYMPQRILPPGAQDSFEIQPYTYRFFIRIAGEKIDEEEIRYNLRSPVYDVSIYKGEKLVFEGNSMNEIIFDGNMRLGFFQPTYWVWLEAVKDRFFPVIVLSIALIMTGLLTRMVLIVIKLKHIGFMEEAE